MAEHDEGTDATVTDPNAFSAEEQALFDQMQQDGDGNPADDGKPAAPAPKPEKPAKPAAAAKPEGEKGTGEGDGNKDGKPGDDTTNNKMVPHAALHETRLELKEAREAAAKREEEHKAEMAKAMDRFEKTLAAFAPKKEEPKPEPVPDFETDPAGWIAHTMQTQGKSLEAVQTELATLKQEKAKAAETSKQQAAVKEIFDYAVEQEKTFKASNPDYDDASKFILESRQTELAFMGYTPQQIAEMINVERLTIAHQAKQQGKNPAEIVYNIAKSRGYAKKAPDPLPGEGEGGGGGKQPTAEEVARQRLDAAQKGRQQDQGLSGANGNAPSPLTAQRLLELPDAEFDRLVHTPEGRALLGV